MLRYLTAGESHGPGLIAIVDGIPAGLQLTAEHINTELERRQLGFGRGARMQIEKDRVEVLSGVRYGVTIGSPISILIRNRDWENWKYTMAIEPGEAKEKITRPRPGHADLAGLLKRGEKDIRNILERASARETASRVAVGAVSKRLLIELGIRILSHVVSIGSIRISPDLQPGPNDQATIDKSPVRCWDDKASKEMVGEIEKAKNSNDTLGGIFEVIAFGLPPGIGDYTQWDRKLDGQIAGAMISIQAIKGVEFGLGFNLGTLPGSIAHDEIFYEPSLGYYRKTNRAGGIEGGMTNGEKLVVRAVMKPIATLGKPLQTVDMITKEKIEAFKERADICAVPSAAVVGEAVIAIELAKAVLAKYGSDSLIELKSSYERYIESLGK